MLLLMIGEKRVLKRTLQNINDRYYRLTIPPFLAKKVSKQVELSWDGYAVVVKPVKTD